MAKAKNGQQLVGSTESRRVLHDSEVSYTVEMPVAEWIAMPDHPRQRDTERHSRKSHWKLARGARGPVAEALRWVIAADFAGTLYKVDGHTRAYLWDNQRLPVPKTVFATIYRCKSISDVNEVYGVFDTQVASETLYDQVTGAFREQGLDLKSKRLRAGTIVDALSIARRAQAGGKDDFDLYEAVAYFSQELRLLDSVDPQPDQFHTGVVSAALLALALNSNSLKFFARLATMKVPDSKSPKKKEVFDPVERVLWNIAKIKKDKTGWKPDVQMELCTSTLGAIESWKKGEKDPQYWSAGNPTHKAPQLADVVENVRELKKSKAPRFE
jgi:hypothetical protein